MLPLEDKSMYYLRLIASCIRVSIQEELAYRSNFFVSLLNSLLNLGTGILGIILPLPHSSFGVLASSLHGSSIVSFRSPAILLAYIPTGYNSS